MSISGVAATAVLRQAALGDEHAAHTVAVDGERVAALAGDQHRADGEGGRDDASGTTSTAERDARSRRATATAATGGRRRHASRRRTAARRRRRPSDASSGCAGSSRWRRSTHAWPPIARPIA